MGTDSELLGEGSGTVDTSDIGSVGSSVVARDGGGVDLDGKGAGCYTKKNSYVIKIVVKVEV